MSLRQAFQTFVGAAVEKKHQPRAQQLLDAVVFQDELKNISGSAKKQLPGLTLEQVLRALYPVGSLYFSDNSSNPAITLGFGVWALRGQFEVIL